VCNPTCPAMRPARLPTSFQPFRQGWRRRLYACLALTTAVVACKLALAASANSWQSCAWRTCQAASPGYAVKVILVHGLRIAWRARSELHDLLAKPSLAGIPLLVLGNKNDLPDALGTPELIERLDLKARARTRTNTSPALMQRVQALVRLVRTRGLVRMVEVGLAMHCFPRRLRVHHQVCPQPLGVASEGFRAQKHRWQ